MNNTEQKKNTFLELYPKKNYHISKTCKAVGISRSTYYLWIDTDEYFKEKVIEAEEADIDDSEETLRILRKGIPKLDKNKQFKGWISKPDTTAVIFHLKTKGKDRGYIEQTETKNIRETIPYDLTKLSDEDISKIEEILSNAKK